MFKTSIDNSLTRGNKAEILGWIPKPAPNYSAGISFASGYVAPAAGFIVLAAIRKNDSQNYGYVNGQLVYRNMQAGSGADSSSGTAIVDKGDTITFSGTGIDTARFYPFKGA